MDVSGGADRAEWHGFSVSFEAVGLAGGLSFGDVYIKTRFYERRRRRSFYLNNLVPTS